MKIAIDLQGTLIAECGEFACQPTGSLARSLVPHGLRQGARTLLSDLARGGHQLTLYSSAPISAVKLRLWCLLLGLPFWSVVTLEQEKKRVLARRRKSQKRVAQELKALSLSHMGKPEMVSWPPCQGHDLILDDNPQHLQAAWRAGVKGVLVTNRERDWTARIREATLQSGDMEVIASPQAA